MQRALLIHTIEKSVKPDGLGYENKEVKAELKRPKIMGETVDYFLVC